MKDVNEANIVLGCGANIVDFKNPRNGSLGAIDESVLRTFLESVPELKSLPKLSFAAGELWEAVQAGLDLNQIYGSTILDRFHYVKVGLAKCQRLDNWRDAWVRFFDGAFFAEPVMVAYVDAAASESPSVGACIEFAAQQSRCHTLLLDTFDKQHDLFKSMTLDQLRQTVAHSHAVGLKVMVAGSVTLHNLASVLASGGDGIGVRGAVCDRSRTGAIVPEKVVELSRRINQL